MIRKIFPISLLALFLTTPVTTWSAVQNQSETKAASVQRSSQSPSVFKNVQGELSRVDDVKQFLWIKRSDGKEMEFKYTSQTQVTGGDNSIQGLANMSGNLLLIQYQTVGGTNQAVKIEIRPAEGSASAG